MDPTIIAAIIRTVADALPRLVELFTHLGGRDAFLVAVDAALISARAKTDADLDAKHRAKGGPAQRPNKPAITGPLFRIADRVIGCRDCGKPSALVGDPIPHDDLCAWCRDGERKTAEARAKP